MAEVKRVFVDFWAGLTVGHAYEVLAKERESYAKLNNISIEEVETYGIFNEKELNSSMTEDECFIKICGKTKAEWEAQQRAWHEEYERKEREYKEKIPALTEEYAKQAKTLIREDRYDMFVKEVLPARLSDCYHGYDIEATFKIIEILNGEGTRAEVILKAKEAFEDQGHSGRTACLVALMVRDFAPKYGPNFFTYVYKGEGTL